MLSTHLGQKKFFFGERWDFPWRNIAYLDRKDYYYYCSSVCRSEAFTMNNTSHIIQPSSTAEIVKKPSHRYRSGPLSEGSTWLSLQAHHFGCSCVCPLGITLESSIAKQEADKLPPWLRQPVLILWHNTSTVLSRRQGKRCLIYCIGKIEHRVEDDNSQLLSWHHQNGDRPFTHHRTHQQVCLST